MSQKWQIIAFVLAFITLPFLYALEMQHWNRVLHAGRLLSIAAVIGLMVGILIGFQFQKKETEAVGRIRAYAVSIVLAVIVCPLLASWSNRLLSFHAVQEVPVEFVEESARYSSRFGASSGESAQTNFYITFFYKEQELLNIHTQESLFPNAERGDTVVLPIKKGLWGIEMVVQP